MKKLIAFALLFNGFMLAGRCWQELDANAGTEVGTEVGTEPCARESGDVNGNGVVELADAVKILGNLFLGVPTDLVPVCVAQNGDLEMQVDELLNRVAALEMHPQGPHDEPGSFNTAVGLNALASTTSGNQNDAFGNDALVNTTSGSRNVAFGYKALGLNATGDDNTAVGNGALSGGTGSFNIGLGHGAGILLGSGNRNIMIGHLGRQTDNNTIRIGTPRTHTTTHLTGDVQIDGTSVAAALAQVASLEAQVSSLTEDLKFVAAGFVSLGTNADTSLKEYRHLQTGIDFVLLPGGTFEMGSPLSEANRETDEGPEHIVALDSFLIAKYEVTQAQYEAVMAGHPTLSATPSNFVSPDLPVEQVSWNDLKAVGGFLERTGLSLPSEAQWEYATRAGTESAFSFGNDCNAFSCDPCTTADNFMFWCGNAEGSTHPVGAKQPNPFGLFDTHGNVWEWCEDVYDAGFYSTPAAAGPNPVATSGSVNRVIRGGSWSVHATRGRSARRGSVSPAFRSDRVFGFRAARSLP